MFPARIVIFVSLVCASNFKDTVCYVILACSVTFNNSLNQIFGHVGIVGKQLLGVLGQTVATIAEAGIVVMAADARVEAYAIDDLLSVQSFALGVGVQLIEVGHAQRQISVSKQLDGLGLGEAHK